MNGRQTENAYVRMDEKMSGACYVYIPLKIYDREVEITEARIALEKGGQYHFQTKLYGSGNADTISWSVEGNFSNETSVDSQGILKIGLDETAKTLIVKAALDGQKEPSKAEVIVYDESPVITEVKIVSGPTKAFPKDVVSFTAEAIGTHLDKSVIWAIKGNSSPDTYISKDGVLTIASNERASSLKVIAKANKNPEILCEKEISIETASEIKLVNIGFDQKTFDFTTAKSPNELNVSVGMRLYSMTPEVVVPKTASALETQKYVGKEEYDLLDSIGLDQNRKCRIRCIVDPANSNGFYWPEEVKALKEEVKANTLKAVTVLVNGEKREDVTVEYRADRFFLYIPIGKPACGSAPRLIKTPATCRAEGKESYYHCSDCGKNFWDFGKKKEITDLSVLKKLPMAAHSYGEGTLTKSPTKTKSGEKTYTCKVCGKTKIESVPALAKDNKKVIKDTKTKDSFVVLSVKKKSGTVIYQKPKNKNVKTVTIPERIKVKGITYNVVGIEKNAFAGCKKLKTIQIQSKKLAKKNIEKGAFNGLKKSTVIKVPKKKLKAYAAMFRQKGLTKSVKIK